MLAVKIFEVRDEGTCMPVIAVKVRADNPAFGLRRQNKLIQRAGWGFGEGVYFVPMCGGEAQRDPYSWKNSRTKRVAHQYIANCFDALEDGAMIDVKKILGEGEMQSDLR